MLSPLSRSPFKLLALLACVFILSSSTVLPQDVPANALAALKWRLIGPFRGGRALTAAGIPGDPATFYFGAVGGGVWKTTDGGVVWRPLFDSQPIASIGALAIAPSDPKILYVGSGEADMRSDISFGDGLYKSTDAGATWTPIGLRDSHQIGRILVDPHDPNIVLVAALGHAYGPNIERGIFRSTDGGKTWSRVLYKDENTGAVDLCFDPENSKVVYASLWRTRRPPWNVYPPSGGPGSGLYKSRDNGQTWQELQGNGLPSGEWGRVGIAVGYGKDHNRVYALIDAREGGLFRSDDAGKNWQRVSTDSRVRGRAWYFSGVTVDPHNADVVYIPNVSIYKSTDAGKTFVAFKGAPGGDDYHFLWIDPTDSQRMIVASDQGTVISVNGGRTWSSWYNQPTAQFYHVVTDHRFPYHVYGAQQDSGTAAVLSRSDYGSITFRNWYPVGAGESGTIAPDPTNPNIVFGGDTNGRLFRFNRVTGQSQNISPSPASAFGEDPATAKFRFTWTSPLVFSPLQPHTLYFGSQFVLQTKDGGMSWTKISPDLTRHADKPPKTTAAEGGSIDTSHSYGRGVVYSIAPSFVKSGVIWAGTDDGLIQLTRDDGKAWHNVTPPELTVWSKIGIIEASHFDPATAYAAVDRHRLDDYQPYIYRTHDFGKTWKRINDGIREPAFVNAVREDPVRKGLLFAGTELGVYVSFDDGEHWQPLQLNLPVASIRDLAVEQNDLIAATHGRSFWILDDIASLRQMNRGVLESEAHLFKPQDTVRVRENVTHDTPLPPEEPAGQNPPYGALIDYYLKSEPAGDVSIEILDNTGKLVRKFSSSDKPFDPGTPPFPNYWLRPAGPPSKNPGLNRLAWDLRYPRPAVLNFQFGIAAAFGANAPALPMGPRVLPGTYRVRLAVNGKSYSQTFSVKPDPRVTTARLDLVKQFDLEMKIDGALKQDFDALTEARKVREQIKKLDNSLSKTAGNETLLGHLKSLDEKIGGLLGEGGSRRSAGAGLARLNGGLAGLMTVVDTADRAPTAAAQSAFADFRKQLDAGLQAWNKLKQSDLADLNTELRNNHLQEITP
ncbi:MAG: hypothetical protein PHX83_07995 [Acidobacteriia bacterium]|nr:hypothetical protein [Terriglobia bacterium]